MFAESDFICLRLSSCIDDKIFLTTIEEPSKVNTLEIGFFTRIKLPKEYTSVLKLPLNAEQTARSVIKEIFSSQKIKRLLSRRLLPSFKVSISNGKVLKYEVVNINLAIILPTFIF